MSVTVDTRDCTALTDGDLEEIVNALGGQSAEFGVGHLSKAKEEWVLATTARVDEKLHGVLFATLERIGGTPCVLLGLMSIKRSSKRDSVLKGLMGEAYHRALMAFPDEDVLFGTRFVAADGFEVLKQLTDIVPRPEHKPVGEERAWGRRLAKRFGHEGSYDEQAFQVRGNGSLSSHADFLSSKPDKIDPDVAALFAGVTAAKGDCLIACGWVMAESLLKLGAR